LADRANKSGSVVASLWQGSRSLMVEVQALVTDSPQGNPRRLAVGVDQNRMNMLIAVLSRHGGVAMYDQEIYVNLVGGLRTTDTSVDLAVVLAMLSSFKDILMPKELMAFGELGLSGDLRAVPSGLERIKQAAQQGFKYCICPAANAPKKMPDNIKLLPVKNLDEAITRLGEIPN